MMAGRVNGNLRCVWPLASQLGEGPLWDAARQRLYFVDIKRSSVHALAPANGVRRSWRLPDQVCWLIARRDGDGFVAGVGTQVVRLWLEPGLRIAPLAMPQLAPGVRLNDAKADGQGRIWAGTMHDTDPARADGELLRLDADGTLSVRDRGYHICNGPAFSLDGATMYHSDSLLGRVYAYRGGARTVWRQFDVAGEGAPDGMTVDQSDCIWVAQWGGGRVCRYSADGALLEAIRVPVSQPTSCTFGGPELKTLFITSARMGLSAAQLEREPLAGALFAIDLPVGGVAADRY